MTHYPKALAREVPEISKKVDPVSVSGALNQVLKRTKTSLGGGADPVSRLLIVQLAGARIVKCWLDHTGKARSTFYSKVKSERTGTNIKPDKVRPAGFDF